jgi:ADP-heptose:LPS heptosyltransferase
VSAYLTLALWRLASPGRKVIAFARLEHLGDIVACEPLLRAIRRKNPGAHIVWFVRRPYRELLAAHPCVDRAVVLHCLTSWILLARSGVFDEVVDLHFEGLECAICLMPLCKTAGDRTIRMENYYHRGSLLDVFSQAAGMAVRDEGPQVHIPPEAVGRVEALRLPPRFIAIHGESAARERNWHAARWAELSTCLAGEGHYVIEIGPQTTLGTWRHPRYVNLCGKLSILETAEVIRRALLFIGVDSGPAHLANAVGTPGVILIGRYMSFVNYMPFSGAYRRGENVEILYTEDSVREMPVARVLDAARRRMEFHLKKEPKSFPVAVQALGLMG